MSNDCGQASIVSIQNTDTSAEYPGHVDLSFACDTAVVTSDRPVVALVNDVSENGRSDAATYIGLAAGDPEPAGPAGPAPLLGLGLRLDRAATGEGRWRAYLAVGR